MRIAVPHHLGKDEARRRVREKSGEIADFIPGYASVKTDWPGEDVMRLTVAAMGQELTGQIEVADSEVAFSVDIPAALAFFEPMIRSKIEVKGRKLLG
ncbi:MAG: polyhydroxyalkanoic acid system family protein [Novosphingobium sp.]